MTKRDPVVRTYPMASDINLNGHIFGGWVLSQMDIAGGAIAGPLAKGPVATVAVEAMKFVSPILVGDCVTLYAWPERIGRTSINVKIQAFARRRGGSEEILVTEGNFIFVAITAEGHPRPIEPESQN